MLSERDELTKITNRLECSEATLKYFGDRLSDMKVKYNLLGQYSSDLNARIIELEKEVLALREALSIREAGPQGIVPLGPEEES